MLPQSEEDFAFAVQRGFGGVEVALAGAGAGGCAADEPDEVPVQVVDAEDDPAAEHVDEPAGAGAAGEPGAQQVGVGEPECV